MPFLVSNIVGLATLRPSFFALKCSFPVHSQGIVHRDIKPANLLWTEDRSQVKIADFGVSHATVVEEFKNSQADSRHVFDELARMAGTPAFLAPELVYVTPDGETDVPSQRPRITKAIDIWALGVTMYCLLFGKTPFDAPDTNLPPLAREQQLYVAIRDKDFTVALTMGSDRISTGGRHPEEGTRGYTIIHLLDHLMEKDPTERIEMGEIKVRESQACYIPRLKLRLEELPVVYPGRHEFLDYASALPRASS